MIQLNPNEARVLGVLIEKAQSTPAQYPLTLNALTLGCNQKNNRDPLLNLSEEAVFDAVDTLRGKGIVREAMLSGSRVAKFRHVAREALGLSTPELVILAELLLRGPQSAAELRARAARMHPMESQEAIQALLDGLISRPEPLVHRLGSGSGSRTTRYAQVLSPDSHPARGDDISEDSEPADTNQISDRLAVLEGQVATLRRAVKELAEAAGLPNPLG